jgi:hypothetical protein
MIRKFNIGDIVRIKFEYHDLNTDKNVDTLGIITDITKSCDHEFEGLRRLEEHTGKTIDIIKIMTSDGNISEWFDDEIDHAIHEIER